MLSFFPLVYMVSLFLGDLHRSFLYHLCVQIHFNDTNKKDNKRKLYKAFVFQISFCRKGTANKNIYLAANPEVSCYIGFLSFHICIILLDPHSNSVGKSWCFANEEIVPELLEKSYP